MERTTAYWLDDFLFFRAVDDSKTAPKNFITLYNFLLETYEHLRLSYLFVFIGGFGGANRNRTDDLLNAIQALSQLSYSPTSVILSPILGWVSNPFLFIQ